MRIFRLRDVLSATGLSRSTLYKYISEGTFPKPVSLGDRCVGWLDSEVFDWILARVEERDLAEGTVPRTGGHLSVAS
ncbi:AlpA family transcriptional regulator [Pseudomonas chengduensis]